MSNRTDLDRDLIRSARIQFSPTTQSVKWSALDKIVEQSVGIFGADGVTVDEVVQKSSITINGSEIPVVRPSDVVDSVKRLVSSGRIEVIKSDPESYVLTEMCRNEFSEVRRESTARAERIVTKLFKNRVSDPVNMVKPFFELLGRVFTRLGSSYVLTLKGDTSTVSPIAHQEIASATSAIATQYHLKEPVLLRAATQFFSATDPDSVTAKWNLAQNFYISLALGMDPMGTLLSGELVGECDLYLDTNVVIQGLEASARFHRSFKTLVEACRNMGIVLKVWNGTLGELNRVVHHYTDVIRRAADRVPPASEPKVRGLFYEKYRDAARDSDEPVDVAVLFANFFDARKILQDEYDIEIEDESVEVEEKREHRLELDLEKIIELYGRRRRLRKKRRRSALHDAAIVEKAALQAKTGRRCLVVTLDLVLSDVRLRGQEDRSVAIGLDAFLQWISPFAGSGQVGHDFAEIFSGALASHLFPDDTFFDINDFLIFAEIDWDTRQLPAEDVENCVLHLKNVAHQLDPSKPADRERLHGEIARFFADPGRKFLERMQEMQKSVKETRTDAGVRERSLRDELDERSQRVKELEDRLKQESDDRSEVGKRLEELEGIVGEIGAKAKEQENTHREEILALGRSRDSLEAALEEEKRKRSTEVLKRSTRVRGVWLLLVWMASVGLVGVGAVSWGFGDNLYQRVLHSWPFFLLTAAIPGVLARPILGKARISTLGSALRRFLRIGSQ